MVVRDIQTGEQFQFICNQWLAVEEGDGLIDRLVAVAGEEQLRDLSHVFTHSVDKSMADDHLWFSVFLRPPRSRFTRVQRLSSCMALLYLSMLVNAMFYQKVPEDGAGGGLRLGPELIAQQEKDKDKNKVSFSPSLSRSTSCPWVMKRPIDEFEDYDDDEEEFHPSRDEELLRGPRALGSGVSRRNKNQIGTNLTEEEIAAAKEKRLQEVAMQDLLLEILVYMIFLTLILSVSHGTKDPNVFLMR
ncbi:hypothetical protein Pmani_018001 [Petrolisthes manimaculis]|uniref:PLAT domain-containing protein n=1 Tax=Petrolisthes manimaculis TaxID=1843537 RepID=A0AAE1PM84_9EUCA|nr:hypothetical protein Pmani_018001 [Petrolisthes manimaculis]